MLLDILKAFGALASTAFGIYGIGASTRTPGGKLNRAGWISLIGLVVSLLVALSTQIVEAWHRSDDALAEAKKYEQLVRSALYASLTTQDAKLDLKFSIGIADIRAVDSKYADRLETAFNNRECPDRKNEVVSADAERTTKYECADYKVQESQLFGTYVTFTSLSTLVPNAKSEPYAYELVRYQGVSFDVKPAEKNVAFFDSPPRFMVGKWLESATYSFDGKELEIAITKQPLDRDVLANANISSIVDILGSEIKIDANELVRRCPNKDSLDSPTCKEYQRILLDSRRLWRFALTFPHRRDIVFDRTRIIPGADETVYFTERVLSRDANALSPLLPDSQKSISVYVYRMPDAVEKLETTDRRDPMAR